MLIVKKLIDIFAKYVLAIGKSLQKLISFHIRYFGGYKADCKQRLITSPDRASPSPGGASLQRPL